MKGGGEIQAKGGNAQPRLRSMVRGSGGGAGGSIFLEVGHLSSQTWDGSLAVDGGDGSDPGGGGGAGGRIKIQPPNGARDWHERPNFEWKGKVHVQGGNGGQRGGGGTYRGPDCEPGNFGFACQACPAGKYRDDEMQSCSKCSTGKYSNSSGKGACLPCPQGLAAPQIGMQECEICPDPGYYADGTGHCVPCPLGRKVRRSQFVRMCEDSSTIECECSRFKCVSTFVSVNNLTCGPLFDVRALIGLLTCQPVPESTLPSRAPVDLSEFTLCHKNHHHRSFCWRLRERLDGALF